VIAARLTSTGYASAWALVHYLATQEKEKRKLLTVVREASEIGPLGGATDVSSLGVVRSNREAFVKQFGDDFIDLEARLIENLKNQPYTNPFPERPPGAAKTGPGKTQPAKSGPAKTGPAKKR
jgi:hypothetical protein